VLEIFHKQEPLAHPMVGVVMYLQQTHCQFIMKALVRIMTRQIDLCKMHKQAITRAVGVQAVFPLMLVVQVIVFGVVVVVVVALHIIQTLLLALVFMGAMAAQE